ncbi:16S rRNA (uracil(1498)-N(3))-methyltransferase [soil metagenome]
MPLHRFFVAARLSEGAVGQLDDRQARQVLSVLRLRRGDQIVVFDGTGVEVEAVLTAVNRSEVQFEIGALSYPAREPDLTLTVGLSLLRGDRFEVAIQKLTEIGVRRIVPLTAQRCVVSFPDAGDWEKRAIRYERIIVEALEQSERVTTVDLTQPTSVQDFLSQHTVIALVERGQHVSIALAPLEPEMTLAIGPEGGWSEQEIDLIGDRATTASLGPLIMRAETAAIVSAGTLMQRSYACSE